MSRRSLLAVLLGLAQLAWVAATPFDPCAPIKPIRKGSNSGFVVGLAFWPGGNLSEWGEPGKGIDPCDKAQLANLTSLGIQFASYSARIDHLTVLKTTFAEQLALTAQGAEGAPRVISVVAFRGNIRSEARYIVSGEPALTHGTGFVGTLSLMSKFERGVLKYLQFYNLTCNDCGGWNSSLCIAGTSCAIPADNCTCTDAPLKGLEPTIKAPAPNNTNSSAADSSGGGSSSVAAAAAAAAGQEGGETVQATRRRLSQAVAAVSTPENNGTCNYTQFAFCATGINLAYDGLDAGGAAFGTASQIRKLNSYSMVELFGKGRVLAADLKSMYRGLFDTKLSVYWGKFGELRKDVAAAFKGGEGEPARMLGSTP